VTPDDIDWPPPICTACKDRQHDDCWREAGCECIDCPWLYEETP
jgi:hypothetical protein